MKGSLNPVRKRRGPSVVFTAGWMIIVVIAICAVLVVAYRAGFIKQ